MSGCLPRRQRRPEAQPTADSGRQFGGEDAARARGGPETSSGKPDPVHASHRGDLAPRGHLAVCGGIWGTRSCSRGVRPGLLLNVPQRTARDRTIGPQAPASGPAALLPREARAEGPRPRGWGTPRRGASPANGRRAPRVSQVSLAGWDSVWHTPVPAAPQDSVLCTREAQEAPSRTPAPEPLALLPDLSTAPATPVSGHRSPLRPTGPEPSALPTLCQLLCGQTPLSQESLARETSSLSPGNHPEN